MNNYCCPDCNREFKKKCHLDDHLNKKKKPCIQHIVNSAPTKCKVAPKITIIEDMEEVIEDDEEVILNKNNKVNEPTCTFCTKTFTRLSSLKRHLDGRCSEKNHNDELNKLKEMMMVIMQNDKIKNETLMKAMSEIEQIKKENEMLKGGVIGQSMINSNNTNTNNTNNTNNGAINNGTVNNTTINNIVQFGKEDISKLDLIEMMNIYLKSTGGNIFPNMLRYINLNPNFPQNFNILMGDFARENVKVHDGKKFVTKKFKNIKNDILNVLNNHITNMCDTFIENPKIKKTDNVLSKMKINNISVKLINNDDITPLLRQEMIKNVNIPLQNMNGKDNKDNEGGEGSEEDIDYLDPEAEKKLAHYETKRQGLQDITEQKLKDELYNNRDMVEKYHLSIKK